MIKLFHVSDLHFGSEDRAAIDWFSALVWSEKPDAVICTGDLTMRARSAEFAAAGAWLRALRVPVTVEVGNHDLPYFNPWARFIEPYARYDTVEKMVEQPLTLPGWAVVPLRTTARFQWRLNWAKGFVSGGALRETLRAIEEVPDAKRVLVACHHPLIDAETRNRARTRGGSGALEALAAAGVRAVLSGHTHQPFDMRYPTASGDIRLIGAGTLSTRLRESAASFNVIAIDGDGIAVSVRERVI